MFGSSSAIRILCVMVSPCRGGRVGQVNRRGARDGSSRSPMPPAEVLDDLAADRQAQAGALRPVAAASPPWRNSRTPMRCRAHAGAVVLHLDAQRRRRQLACASRCRPAGNLAALDSRFSSTCVSRSGSARSAARCGQVEHFSRGAALAEHLGGGRGRLLDSSAAGRRRRCAIRRGRPRSWPCPAPGSGATGARSRRRRCRGTAGAARLHQRVVAHQLGERADREAACAARASPGHEVVLQPVQALQLLRRADARSCEASSRMHHVVRPSDSSCTTEEPPSLRADALPIAPASWVSAKCTSARVGQQRASPSAQAAFARVGENACARSRRGNGRSAAAGRPPRRCRARTPAVRPRAKTSTNSSAWPRLARRRRRAPATRRRTARVGQQAPEQRECVRLSSPRPNSCSG